MSKFCVISLFVVWSVLLFAQSVSSETSPASPPKKNNPYILRGINKAKVAKLKNGNKVYDKCWKKRNSYEVCLTRTSTEEYFTWINEKIPLKVLTKRYPHGSYNQRWLFKKGGIEFFKGANGKFTQSLELPNTKWEYTKLANGEVSEEWKGKKDEKALQDYKSMIDSWCAVNDFYMGKENCAIYELKPAQSEN